MNGDDRKLIGAAALVCAVVIYVYPLSLHTPLLDPDEGLHAAISQEMVESGDYVIPRFRGEPFRDKPILYFAAQSLSLRAFGMNEAAVRLPGLAFALLGAVTTALLARRLFDGTTGLLALLVALTSIVPMSLAQAAVHDVALVPWTNLLALCWWSADHESSRRKRMGYTVGAGVCISLALLTKGLIGVAVIGVGYALYLVVAGRLSRSVVARGAISLSLGVLLASPWFIAMEMSTPGYLHYYFVERHLMGFATSTQVHGHGHWYYYPPLIIGGTLPWCLYAVAGLWQFRIDKRLGVLRSAAPTLFVVCLIVGGLVFLSAARSKLITYALPLYPGVSILAACSIRRLLAEPLAPKVETLFAWMFQGSCALGCVVPIIFLAGFDRYNQIISPASAYLTACVAAATTLAAMILFRRARRPAAIAAGALWFAALFVMVMTWPMQPLAERFSQRQLGREIAALPELPDRIVVTGGRVASLVFYLTPAQRRQLRPGQVAAEELASIHLWPAVPANTLLAAPTWAWDRWPNKLMQQHTQEFGRAGEYCLLKAGGTPANVAQRGEAHRW